MITISNRVITYNLNKNILFDKVSYGENHLLLYDNASTYKRILRNFTQLVDNATLFYISHSTNPPNFNFDIKFDINIITEDTLYILKKELNKVFRKMEEGHNSLLIIADWSKVNLNNNYGILSLFLEDLIKRTQNINPPLWKRRYGETSQKAPINVINVFEIKNIKNSSFIHKVISVHQRVYLLQKDVNTFLLPAVSPSLETIFPKFHVLPSDILGKVVKDNLEIMTLLFLEKGPKSGYNILKDIAQHFHCILSQGTLYPMLYHLERENKIFKQNGKGREVIYSLTNETKNSLQVRKETLLNAYQHLASFFAT